MSFKQLMAKIDDAKRSMSDQERFEGDAFALGMDAYELGLEHLERGNLDRAERWLQCASRYEIPEATDRLADLDELRTVLADFASPDLLQDLRSEQEAADSRPSEASSSAEDVDAASVHDRIIDEAHERAHQVLEAAQRQAAEIVANAREEAAQLKDNAVAGTSSEVATNTADFLWHYMPNVRSNLQQAVTGPPGVGKTSLFTAIRAQLEADAVRDGVQPPRLLIVTANNRAIDQVDRAMQPSSQTGWHRSVIWPQARSLFVSERQPWLFEFKAGKVPCRRDDVDARRDELIERMYTVLARYRGVDRRSCDALLRTLTELFSSTTHEDGGVHERSFMSSIRSCLAGLLDVTEPIDRLAIEGLMFELAG